MLLLNEAMQEVILMEKRRNPDGEGGFITEWIESVIFNAAITFDNSIQAKIAESQGVKSLYSVIVPKNAKLEYHDVIKRVSDGKIFRITSDGDDEVTPSRATFQFSKVSAEEWNLV